MLDVLTDKSSNHDELENSCLTNSKMSDIECLFNMTENDYRILITSMFEADKFIRWDYGCSWIQLPNPYSNFLTKKKSSTSSSSTNIEKSSSSNIKKNEIETCQKIFWVQNFRKTNDNATKISVNKKKQLAQRFHEWFFWRI